MLPLCWPACVTVAGDWLSALPGDRLSALPGDSSLVDRENPMRGGRALGSVISLLLKRLLQPTRQGVQSVSQEAG